MARRNEASTALRVSLRLETPARLPAGRTPECQRRPATSGCHRLLMTDRLKGARDGRRALLLQNMHETAAGAARDL
jgi:hypothetical protein